MNHFITWAIVTMAIAVGQPAAAQWEPIQPDFTFKRVPAPTSGTTARITVQIDPSAPPLPGLVSGPPPRVTLDDVTPDRAATRIAMPAPSGFEWFWTIVPSDVGSTGAARFAKAMEHLNDGNNQQAVPTPRLQALQDIASAHGRDILKETVGTQVSPALVLAVISVESAGQPTAVSTAGAEGLMQLMPDTATRFGVSDSFDTAQNIAGGVAYLEWLLDRFDNDALLALAGYNAGEGNVDQYAGVPPFPETRAYIPKVLAAWQVAKGLCATPPQLITDACVFNVNKS